MALDIAEKLDEARALIEKGWCQGEAQIGDCYCALGACCAVIADGSPDYFDLREMLQRATGAKSVSLWNDRPDRTQAEVIDAFRKAAELARERSA